MLKTHFSPYATLIKVVASVLLLLGVIWGANAFLEHQQEKGYNKAVLEYKDKLAEAKEAADKVEDLLRSQVADAQQKGNQREQTIRTVASGGAAASASLRDALQDIRSSLPGKSAEAASHTASTLANVLADCQAKYRELAEAADRHASDTQTLSEGWPVTPQPSK